MWSNMLSCIIKIVQVFPTVFTWGKSTSVLEVNGVFHLVACHYNFQRVSESGRKSANITLSMNIGVMSIDFPHQWWLFNSVSVNLCLFTSLRPKQPVHPSVHYLPAANNIMRVWVSVCLNSDQLSLNSALTRDFYSLCSFPPSSL